MRKQRSNLYQLYLPYEGKIHHYLSPIKGEVLDFNPYLGLVEYLKVNVGLSQACARLLTGFSVH
jgi:hypothetical protein